MKYIKKYENMDFTGYVELRLGEYVKIYTQKSETFDSTHPNYPGYYTKAKDVHIYIDNENVGSMHIDERGFNILRNSIYYGSTKPEYIQNLERLIRIYLIDCHDRLKGSNTDYGTYDDETRKGREGRKNLMAHDFFDFVKNDYETSNSKIVKEIKYIQDNFLYYKDANKYNI